jgi:hypothetical protein
MDAIIDQLAAGRFQDRCARETHGISPEVLTARMIPSACGPQ